MSRGRQMTRAISVRLPESTIDDLERACAEQSMTTSAFVRAMIDHYLQPQPEDLQPAPARRRRWWR